MSAAEDTVHKKAILFEDTNSEMFVQLLRAWMESEESTWKHIENPVYRPSDDPRLECADIRSVLAGADNYWIAKPMCDLAQHASTEMPDEPLLAPDLPSRTGWMVLAEPYKMIDIRRQLICVNAISWTVIGDKVRVWHWVDKNDVHDYINLKMRHEFEEADWNRLPIFTLNHIFEMEFGKELPKAVSWDTPLPPDAVLDVREQQNPDGSWSMAFSTDQYIDITEPPTLIRSRLAAYIVCIWRLCQQSVALRDPDEVPRSMKRRLGRLSIPDKPVSIITLRRIDHGPADPDSEGRDWQHRWWVRSHWRRQPYKENGETIYRVILINSYLKGPEGKPILTRPKVNALVR